MNTIKLAGALGAALFASALALPAQAAMAPAPLGAHAPLVRVDCAVGFVLGPAGACVLGTPDRHDAVIERRATDEGCATRTVKRTDDTGNSETRTTTNCD